MRRAWGGLDAISQGARTFDDDAAALSYGRSEWAGIKDALTPEQQGAVFDYTRKVPGANGITYAEINGALRNGPPYPAEYTDHIRAIDQSLARHPLPDDVVVTRATGVDHWTFAPKDAAGNSVNEASYLTTSLGGPADAFAIKNAILHLRVPEGTPAIWAEDVSAFSGRSESCSSAAISHGVPRGRASSMVSGMSTDR